MDEFNIDKKPIFFSHELFNAEYIYIYFFETDASLKPPTYLSEALKIQLGLK